jgi:Tol biopolymer transport system component/DNA-binding winged helix-turn-helix (wHTH) protein
MQTPSDARRLLAFGVFEANIATRQLFRRGEVVHLQDHPFRVLTMLLERPGELITREELRHRLWPEHTFVDFDEGLNTAVKKLRCALDDSADDPRFIETVPRRGYRFIAAVHPVEDSSVDPEDGHMRSSSSGRLQTSDGHNQLARSGALVELPLPVFRLRSSRRRTALTVAVVCVLIAVVCLVYLHRIRRPERSMHFSIRLPSPMRDMALSGDGRMLAFIAPQPQDGGNALWIDEIGAPAARVLDHTEGASFLFWSPDNKSIAFFADGKLKRIDATGGPVQIICDAPIGRGGTWNKDGVIVFARDSGVSISRVSAAGGPVTLVSGFEQRIATTMSSRWPVFLPDGNHFLYTSVDFGSDLQSDASAIYVAALNSKEHRRLVSSGSNAAYVPPGYLLFVRNKTLMAQRFDAARMQVRGDAFAVANDVEYLSSVARALFSSSTGTLVYQTSAGTTFSRLTWFDRSGRQLSTLGTPARFANPRVSPDGRRVAIDIDDPQSSNTDIWIFEPNRPVPSRFTFDPGQDETPMWSHDGRTISWLSDRGGKNSFYSKAANRSAVETDMLTSARLGLSFASAPSDWSPDGRYLLYTDLHEGTLLHLWVLPLGEGGNAHRLLHGDSADVEGQFSPDGHWVAYSSNESGNWQVYVAPFPSSGGEEKYQISNDGGQQPRWRRDGKELFFLSPQRKLMAVSITKGSPPQFSAPKVLFQTHAHEPLTAEEFFTYDVSADGEKFLINENAPESNPVPADIILNWEDQLTR